MHVTASSAYLSVATPSSTPDSILVRIALPSIPRSSIPLARSVQLTACVSHHCHSAHGIQDDTSASHRLHHPMMSSDTAAALNARPDQPQQQRDRLSDDAMQRLVTLTRGQRACKDSMDSTLHKPGRVNAFAAHALHGAVCTIGCHILLDWFREPLCFVVTHCVPEPIHDISALSSAAPPSSMASTTLVSDQAIVQPVCIDRDVTRITFSAPAAEASRLQLPSPSVAVPAGLHWHSQARVWEDHVNRHVFGAQTIVQYVVRRMAQCLTLAPHTSTGDQRSQSTFCSFLLHGISGGGKSSFIDALASATGFAVRRLSMTELFHTYENQAETALTSFFHGDDAASRVANYQEPCILIMDQIDAINNTADTEGMCSNTCHCMRCWCCRMPRWCCRMPPDVV